MINQNSDTKKVVRATRENEDGGQDVYLFTIDAPKPRKRKTPSRPNPLRQALADNLTLNELIAII